MKLHFNEILAFWRHVGTPAQDGRAERIHQVTAWPNLLRAEVACLNSTRTRNWVRLPQRATTTALASRVRLRRTSGTHMTIKFTNSSTTAASICAWVLSVRCCRLANGRVQRWVLLGTFAWVAESDCYIRHARLSVRRYSVAPDRFSWHLISGTFKKICRESSRFG